MTHCLFATTIAQIRPSGYQGKVRLTVSKSERTQSSSLDPFTVVSSAPLEQALGLIPSELTLYSPSLLPHQGIFSLL